MSRNKWFYLLVLFIILCSCQLPPASYVLYTPLNFSCSTDYGDHLGEQNAEIKANWRSDSCTQSANTWLRFSIYANQTGVSGFVLYHIDSNTNPSYNNFTDLIARHIVNKQILPLDNIVPYIYSDSDAPNGNFCRSTDSAGVDRGQTYPSIYTSANPIINYSTSGYEVSGTTGMTQRQTSIIIPPLECLGTGAFVVTTVDYINKAESHASNILILT